MKKSNIYSTLVQLINSKLLNKPFTVSDINRECNGLLKKSPSFLSKHRVGNPGGHTEYFIRVKDSSGSEKRGYYWIINNP